MRESEKLYYGHRVIVAILLTAIVYVILLLAVSSQITSLQPAGRQLLVNAIIILATGSLLALLALKFSGSRQLSLNIFLFTMATAIVYTGWQTGGMTSPVNPCILVVPVLATLAVGSKAGLLWGLAIFLTGLLLLWMDSAGLTPPSIMAPENRNIGAFLAMMSAHIFLTLIVVYYNVAADRLRRLLDQERQRYQNLAHHDSLTGLANRRHFIDQINRAIALGKTDGSCFSIVYFDLNRFKDANDRYGHHFGDLALVEFARRLLATTRHSDCVARLGGDEFSAMLRGVSDEDTVANKLAQISAELAKPMVIDGIEYTLSASAGYAIFPTHGDDDESLLRRADTDMYSVKPGRVISVLAGSRDG